MHFRAIMFFGFCAAAASALAQDSLVDRGSLKIMAGGQVVGTETFSVEPAGEGFRMRGDLKVKMPDGKEASESSVMNLSRELQVTSYTRVQKAPKKASIQVDMVAGHAKAHYMTPEGLKELEFLLEPAAVILDTNFFHHYILLIARYDRRKGGAQHVQVLIPQEATPGMVLLDYLGKDDGHDKWTVKTDAQLLQIWTDGPKLFKLAVPEMKVEIVRDVK
jgi:hypothetical protein